MNKIVRKIQFSEKVFRLDVEAPLIAKARKAGHFVIVRVGEKFNCKEGMILPDGTPVIPAEFESIKWNKDDYIVCCRKGHCEMLRYVRKRQQGA